MASRGCGDSWPRVPWLCQHSCGGGVVPWLCGPEVPAQRVWALIPGLRVHLAQGDVNSRPVAVGSTTRFLTG